MGTRAPVHQVLLRACVCDASSMCICWQRAHTQAITTRTEFRSQHKHCAHARRHAQASRLTPDDNDFHTHTHAHEHTQNIANQISVNAWKMSWLRAHLTQRSLLQMRYAIFCSLFVVVCQCEPKLFWAMMRRQNYIYVCLNVCMYICIYTYIHVYVFIWT